MRSDSTRRPKVDLRALEVFVTVAETGNMTVAARKLAMTQPAVSQIFRRLEDDVRSPLLDRDLRPLRLTPAGVAVFTRAKQLLADVARLRREIHLASDSILPRLRIGFVDSFATTAGPQLVKSMQAEVEQLLVWSGIAPQLRQHILNRDLDMVISPDALDGIDGIECERLLQECYIVVVPPQWRERAESLSLTELARGHPLIRYSSRSLIGAQVDRHLRWLRIDAPKGNEFDSAESVMAMVAEGIGWTITTPLTLVQAHASMTRVAAMPLPGPALSRSLYLAFRGGEFPGMPERIVERCTQILRGEISNRLRQQAPWLCEQLIVG